MMARALQLLLMAFLLAGCVEKDKLDALDTLFSQVQSSTTASEEEGYIEDVWRYLYENRVYVAVYALNPEKGKVDINKLPEPVNVETVEVVFTKESDKKSYRWTPVDTENIFILFREK